MTAAYALLLTALSPLAAVLLARLGNGVWKSAAWRLRRGRVRSVVAVTDPHLLEDLGLTRELLRQVFREPAALHETPTRPRLCRVEHPDSVCPPPAAPMPRASARA
jgi:uncharacterized protein YjiS (DUF1127 family)